MSNDGCRNGTAATSGTESNEELVMGDMEYDGRVVLYIIKGRNGHDACGEGQC